MQLPYSDKIETQYFSRLFDNMSECYKLFWFQAIVNKVAEGKVTLTFDELINDMIVSAWYMVNEYKLNLGPADTLENLIHYVYCLVNESDHIKSSDNKEKILNYLINCQDKELMSKKRTLTYNVPYRLQAPFLKLRGRDWDGPKKVLEERINQEERVIYYFGELTGLNQNIVIRDIWAEYIRTNQEIIRGWIQYHMVEYLQRRNPSVPGIINKLYPPQERKLEKVKKYWKLLIEFQPIHEVYSRQILDTKDISIDHFVPWSYVAHDEFWNLHPTTRRINSSKSNKLPEWEIYFPAFAGIEYLSYELMWKYPKLHEAFEKCAKEHLNSMDIKNKLYRPALSKNDFLNQLEHVVLPVYQAAENSGFAEWRYDNGQ